MGDFDLFGNDEMMALDDAQRYSESLESGSPAADDNLSGYEYVAFAAHPEESLRKLREIQKCLLNKDMRNAQVLILKDRNEAKKHVNNPNFYILLHGKHSKMLDLDTLILRTKPDVLIAFINKSVNVIYDHIF